MLAGIPGLAIDAEIKLGFQAHFPELETKLAARGASEAELTAKLAAVEAEVRRRLGNFVVAEDEQSLEGVVLEKLKAGGHTLAVGETFTSGAIASRIAPLAGAEGVFRKGVIASDVTAEALRRDSGTSHALVVLMQLDEGPERPDFGATITVQIADKGGVVQRVARLVGGREWVRTGAAEMGLDCLRRHLCGMPVDERIDFERR
jgi:nicotinamide-nucleotide amidase